MTEKTYIAIAIDGPAAADKTTQAKALAKLLGYTYVDTGALYRTLALYKILTGRSDDCLNYDSFPVVEELLATAKITFGYNGQTDQRVYLNGRDVTNEIRTPEISAMSSRLSAVPAVRAHLLDMQRQEALSGNVVMEGRDIGTIVLPDAQHKFFLTADPLVRAYRRRKELAKAGRDVDPVTLVKDIMERDYNDSHREIAPLKKAKDAYVVDCSDLTIEQTTQTLLAMTQLNGLPEA